MKKGSRFVLFIAAAIVQIAMVLSVASIVQAADYAAEDVALTPGADVSELNFAWITADNGTGECAVQIAKTVTGFEISDIFTGTKAGADVNNDGVFEYYYCEVTVADLQNQVNYIYRLGGNDGLWSDTYNYSTKNKNKFGFVFLSDAQIGTTNLATDTAGWVDTIDIIDEEFPGTAFIMSAGDQIDYPGNEDQWAGFFSAAPLTSIPVAPTTGSHDELGSGKGAGVPSSYAYDYHFNIPNETEPSFVYVDLNNCRPGAPPCTPNYQWVQLAAGDYYFSYGKALFMVLNGDSTLMGLNDYDAHRALMQTAVDAYPDAKWKIVMMHYTMYTAASRGMMPSGLRAGMAPIMDDLDIDVVLMGHDHSYCRTYQMLGDVPQAVDTNEDGAVVNPTGTLYITANSSSGSKYYNLAPDITNTTKWYWVAAYGQTYVPTFSYIDVDANSLGIFTYRTDTMEEIDAYTILKVDEED